MKILDYMKDRVLCLDGGMGTLLQARGLLPGEEPERWNLTHPDVIEEIHRAYFDAGSNVVNTNTFGANLLRFSPQELDAIVAAAVENAKRARETSTRPGEKYIALDIGPSGRLLKPFGDLDFEDAVDLFAATVRAGVRCGVDLITIETMNDSYETKAALLAAKENSDLPVFVTNAFGADGKLMTGATPAAMVALLEGMRADAIGINCSLGPAGLAAVAEEYLRLSSLPVIFKPNAGLPVVRDGKTEYDVTPDDFADTVARLVKAGVRIVGGCCGTTPEYIEKLSAETGGILPCPITEKTTTVVSSYTHTVTFGASPVLIGERINPTGKKKFREALLSHDTGYILEEGVKQANCGARILDVNVGLPDIDETEVLTETVTGLQAILDLPLQIDTSSPVAMERAMRRYNGKALINSVNGKEESMRAIFPLVRKYGGTVIALTLDEDGIPATVEGRVAIARKIRDTALEYGIAPRDLIFDTLAMTISADPNAATVTLGALERIRNELGCHTSLGVSNISFGLPRRDAINSVFFASALEHGLSAAIMNPYSVDMMKTYYAFRALHGLDANCADYISFCDGLTDAPASVSGAVSASPSAPTTAPAIATISDAVRKGLGDKAKELVRDALTNQNRQPLDIIDREIIPALDDVGKGYESGKIFLPQLLMSAGAAQNAFEIIRAAFPQSAGKAGGMKIVLATVRGDIHDIGKNIVRLLLENYGFDVIDLGKDVPPETILDEVLKSGAKLVGLSALMTTTVPAMEETIRLLHEKVPGCRVVVGGAVLNPSYAAAIGADAYAADATETVRYASLLRDGAEQ